MNKISKSIAGRYVAGYFSSSILAAGWVADFSFDADATYDDNFLNE